MGELTVVTGLFVSGWTFGMLTGLSAVGALMFSFIAGLSLAISVGATLLFLGLPTEPLFVWVAACGLPFAVMLITAWRPGGHEPETLARRLTVLAFGLICAAVVVYAMRHVAIVKYHSDTFRYLRSALLFAKGETEFITLNDLGKRLYTFPISLSLARIFDEYYIKSLIPTLSLGVLATSLFFFWALTEREAIRRKERIVIAVLMLLLIISNNRYVWNSFYLNTHLYIAACVMIIAAAGAMNERSTGVPQSFLVAIQLLMLPPLVLGRAEGFLLGGLAVLPFVLNGAAPRRDRIAVLIGFGAMTLSWHAYLALAHLRADRDLPLSALGPTALGVAAIFAAPLLTAPLLSRFRRPLLGLAEAGLWLVLAVAALYEPDIFLGSLDATFQNVVIGAGSWGRSLVVLTGIVIFTLSFCKDRRLATLRFPVTAAIPMFFLLAFVRDGGSYRVGNGDSLNRMLIEIFPLSVLYVAVAATSTEWTAPFRRRSRD
ncbi:hypothetical protein FP2506_02015 [Fulvimarina pelagi HTCC2506]|uniref:Uncharacterized protein n=1 Tax=Fulvimarina pelagi HTCC2506 TaxID=314231 RepID=Q0FYL7_9HYPH|nr:hypothetical protein [Fulvimarina pelagi]EAU39978.1 hypothetical protein FP2506_02015 [Fulvimarina pelagi HTCC2506]